MRFDTGPAAARNLVLIVDDDASVRGALKFALEIEGFAVRVYADGGALLAEAELPRCGCLVADFTLPHIDGLDLIERMRLRQPGLPAILITTNPKPAVHSRAHRQNVPIIEKPLLDDTLVEAVRKALA
ncbi:MAG TPA: response regulator [Xanthobacteraceae bacterium]|nr:response regulator [Xanthobacteraceae bacterium]